MAITHTSRFLTTGLIITSIFITACSQQTDNNNEAISLTGTSVSKGDTVITVDQLSDRIIKQQGDYALYDIRSREAFDRAHIKTAQSSSVEQLLTDSNELPPGKDILLYSSQSDKAAQLAALLRVQGINAFYLAGGYGQWQQRMDNVAGSPSSDSSAQAMAKQQAISCWFEGDYVATAGLFPKVPPTQQATQQSGGYVPALKPVTQGETTDELGLGLGLGLGPEEPTDELGLGLGLGLGPEKTAPKGKLNIGEGC